MCVCVCVCVCVYVRGCVRACVCVCVLLKIVGNSVLNSIESVVFLSNKSIHVLHL